MANVLETLTHTEEGLCMDDGGTVITMTLNQREVDDLLYLIGSIGGLPPGTVRETMDPLWELLKPCASINPSDLLGSWEEVRASRTKGLHTTFAPKDT